MQPHDTTEQPIEEWRDIPEFAGRYQASTLGRIRSINHVVVYKNRWGTDTPRQIVGRVLIPRLTPGGHFYVNPSKKSKLVHALVASAFLGTRPKGHDVHHINHNKVDNRPVNLTYIPNHIHDGHHSKGNMPSCAKLTIEQAKEIVELLESTTMLQREIADRFGVSRESISMIKRGKSWKRIR